MSQGEKTGTVLDNKYELTRLLGEGGMGSVYEAQHRLINRRLAVKFLHPQYADNEEVVIRFQREAQSAAKIGHENIIEITDMGTDSLGAPYIVMEYLDGKDVKGLMESDEDVNIERIAHIMIQALSGLQAAHNVGIIHRDLKPENIYITSKSNNPDYVKLLDFGISKFKELETDGAKALTQTGTVLGTPHYMSPEQARGEQDLSPKSDIYAMGVILYQMTTGQLPFDAPNYNALLIKILTEDPAFPEELNPDIPEDMADIIKTAMERDPGLRFQSCDEFKSRLFPYVRYTENTGSIDLRSISKTSMKRAPRATTLTPLEMTRSSRIEGTTKSNLPLILAIAAFFMVGIGAAAFIILKDQTSTPAEPTPTPAAAPIVQTEETTKAEEKKEENNNVEISISAEPENATITIDGALVSNPYTTFFAKNQVTRAIHVSAPGYQDLSEMVVFDDNKNFQYELEKEITQEPEPITQRATTTARRKTPTTTPEPTPQVETRPEPAQQKQPAKQPRRKIDYGDPWGN